ncbi:MAG: heavy-metal-associated domain-containing protein [Gemmatimonadaceae bacterium]
MRTVHCVRAVFQALGGVPGVQRADVTMGRAEVDHAVLVTDDVLEQALEVVGYRLRDRIDDPKRLTVIPLDPLDV